MWFSDVVTHEQEVICYIEHVLVSPTTCHTTVKHRTSTTGVPGMLTTISVSFNTVHINVIDPDANQWDMVSTPGVGGGAFRCPPFLPARTVCVQGLWESNML